jgi:hypothetical protein
MQDHAHIHSNVARQTSLRMPSWLGPWVVAGGAMAVCLTVALRDPRDEGSFGTCPWLLLTGTYCPGCGSLRTLNRLTHADVRGAASYNILLLAIVPFVLYSWFRWALPERFTGRWPSLSYLPQWLIYSFVALVVSFWVVRNFPWVPFSWLAPG